MSRPYICFSSPIIISLLIFCYAGFSATVAITVAAIVCCVPVFFLRNRNDVFNSIFVCCLSLLVASSAYITKTVTDYLPAVAITSEEGRNISGTLCDYEKSYEKYYYTLTDVTVNGIEIKHKIRISSDVYKDAEIDDIFTFSDAVIYELGKSAGTENSHKADNVYLGAYTTDDFSIESAQKHSVRFYLAQIRQFIADSLNKNMHPLYASVANGMLTGDQSDIDESVLKNFRYSGISHMFAVSGFHLALWTEALYMTLHSIQRSRLKTNNFICILFVVFFVALTGFSKSVMRAGVMLIIYLSGKLFRHKSDPLNSLFIAATVIILANPYAVMSTSLQMSFLATLGILILGKPVISPLTDMKEKINTGFLYKTSLASYSTIMISVIASLFTMPVSALNFGYISVAAPLTNLFCAFPAQLLILLSGISVITSKISFIAKPLALICTYLSKFIIYITEFISVINNSVTETKTIIIRSILIVMLGVMSVFLIIFRKNSKRLMITFFTSATVVILTLVCASVIQSSSVKVTVADTGNGTSVMLRTSESDIIIGCGGNDYNSYKFTSATDLNPSGNFDLLLIPRNTETESSYLYTLLKRYNFENCIISQEEYPSYITEILPENSVFTHNCNIQIDTDTTLIYNNSKEFSGVRIISGDFTCTILFKALSDFSVVPDQWTSGSLLIARQSLPDIDLSGFENIIVSSSKEIIYDNRNIYTTRYSGQTDYIMYPVGTAIITEEKHDYKR